MKTNASAQRENAPIDFGGQIYDNAGIPREQQHNQIAAPIGDRKTATSCKRRKDQALREQLLQQAAAPRAHREPDRHFVTPSKGPEQQQIADVGTGNEEHKAGHHERDS